MSEAVSEFASGEEGPGVALESQPTEFAAVELRITGRCCREDLEVDPADTTVEELAEKSQIVRKFVELRTPSPETGQELFAGATSRSDMFTLHAGRLRGVTWHDREYGVTWLLGCGMHREGDRGDAYNKCADLDKRGKLLPTAADYEALIRERDARQLPMMVGEMRALLTRARATPDRTHSALLSVGVRVSLNVVYYSEGRGRGIEEFRLSVAARNLEDGWVGVIRTALWPVEDVASGWEYTRDFPGRPSAAGELRFKHLHDLGKDGP